MVEYRSDVSPPSRHGTWTALVPIDDSHFEYLYQLAIDESTGFRWRFVGAVPTKEEFRQSLWKGALSQFLVVETKTERAIGMVVAYQPDLPNGHVYVGAVMELSVQATGLGIEAVMLFLRYLFTTWNLRKVYFEVPEYNAEWMVNSIGQYLKEEGRLKDHSFYDRRWWDKLILALYYDDYAVGESKLFRSERSHS